MYLTWWQGIFIFGWGLYALRAFLVGFHESRVKKNAYGWMPWYYPLGVFVWGDGVVFGPYWISVVVVCYLLQDWLLFVFHFFVFWVVRSIGETFFWINHQFSTINKYPPHTLPGFMLFHNDSIWFIYQTIAQCVTVVSFILSLYFGYLWVAERFV